MFLHAFFKALTHIPEVDGSNPLPPTSKIKGLEDISQASDPFFVVFLTDF
jgi:hypothetical protein